MPLELEVWAGRLADELRELADPDLQDEAGRLLRVAQRHAPGRLGGALRVEGEQILSEVPYAFTTSEGATIRTRHAQWLLIPLPGQPANVGRGPDYVTIGKRPDQRYVLRKSTGELVAVRRKSVTIRGNRWIGRALEEHQSEAEARLAREGERRLTELR